MAFGLTRAALLPRTGTLGTVAADWDASWAIAEPPGRAVSMPIPRSNRNAAFSERLVVLDAAEPVWRGAMAAARRAWIERV
jgi:hypothetical protein